MILHFRYVEKLLAFLQLLDFPPCGINLIFRCYFDYKTLDYNNSLALHCVTTPVIFR